MRFTVSANGAESVKPSVIEPFGVVIGEFGFFARLYFARFSHIHLFAELFSGNAGVFFVKDAQWTSEALAGGAFGGRIRAGNWYFEPYIRGGYPFLGGAGLAIGHFW